MQEGYVSNYLLKEKLNVQKSLKRLGDLTLNIGNNIPTSVGIGLSLIHI